MTTTHNSQGDHLSSADPSLWVTRKFGKIQSWHTKSVHAVRWMNDNADSIEGWAVTKSYIIRAGFWDRRRGADQAVAFEPELYREAPTFPGAMDRLAAWLHKSWEQDRDNHPSPAGRHAAWERWNDVTALVNIASLTLIPNPAFTYSFGPLSPPEGMGHDLRLHVAPTPESALIRMVERNRNANATPQA